MLFLTWIAILILFWVVFIYFTKGKITRHVGFYHFLLFFYSTYLASYSIYVTNRSVNHLYLASVMLYPLLALLGMIYGSLFGAKGYFLRTECIVYKNDVKLVVTVVTIFLATYLFYLSSLWPNIPLLVTLRSTDAMEGHMGRYLATKGYSSTILGIKFLYWFPRIFIDYFASFAAIFYYYHVRNKKTYDYIKFLLFILFLFLIEILANEKYPAVKLSMVIVLCYFNDKYETFGLRTIGMNIKMILASMTVGSVVYALVSGAYQKIATMNILEVPSYIIYDLILPLLTVRGMEGQSYPLYKLYEIIPAQYDFFMGRTLTNPHGILPYEPVALPYLVYSSYNIAISENLKGADPTVFFGEIYANFGFPLSLLFMFLFGFIVQIIHSKLSDNIEKHRSPFDIAFFYLLMIYIGDFAIGFSVPYFDERVFFFIGVYWLRKMYLKSAVNNVSITPVM